MNAVVQAQKTQKAARKKTVAKRQPPEQLPEYEKGDGGGCAWDGVSVWEVGGGEM